MKITLIDGHSPRLFLGHNMPQDRENLLQALDEILQDACEGEIKNIIIDMMLAHGEITKMDRCEECGAPIITYTFEK